MRNLAYSTRAICLSTLIFVSYGRSATADLVGFWSFDDETATDLSGNGNHGEVVDLGFSDDVPDGTTGKSLDATEDGVVIVEHSDSLDIADTMTIAFWMRADNDDQERNWNGPMSKIAEPRSESGWEMQRFDTQSRLDIRIDTNAGNNSVKGNLTGTYEDEWVHVAWTVDEGFWASYLDGELVEEGNYPHGDGFANEADFYIGTRQTEGLPYQGLLDEIGIWDDVLSDEEISDLAEGISPVDPTDPCDFDGDGSLGLGDVNMLLSAVKAGANEKRFDVTGDDLVNGDDINFYVGDESKLHTYIGDADLNGEFNSTDFVAVFQAGTYETGLDAGWEKGDWNGDGVFSSSDLVSAFQDGGFELGPKWNPQAASIPEPHSAVLATISVIGLLGFVRRRNMLFRLTA